MESPRLSPIALRNPLSLEGWSQPFHPQDSAFLDHWRLQEPGEEGYHLPLQSPKSELGTEPSDQVRRCNEPLPKMAMKLGLLLCHTQPHMERLHYQPWFRIGRLKSERAVGLWALGDCRDARADAGSEPCSWLWGQWSSHAPALACHLCHGSRKQHELLGHLDVDPPVNTKS